MNSSSRLNSGVQSNSTTGLPAGILQQYAVDLSHATTMALACTADSVVTIENEVQLDAFIDSYNTNGEKKPIFVLSGGSNLLLPEQLNTIVLQPQMRGIEITAETGSHIEIEVMAGENWHELVTYTVNQGWYGLENLALIPRFNWRCTCTKHWCLWRPA